MAEIKVTSPAGVSSRGERTTTSPDYARFNSFRTPPVVRFVASGNDMTLEPLTPDRGLELYLDHRRNEVAHQTLQAHRS